MSNKNEPRPRSRRRSSDRRWSASSSVEYYDEAGERLADIGPAVVKGVVRWRIDGKNRKRSFTGPNLSGQIRAFQSHLGAAYEGDWPAAGDGTPLQPTTLVSVAEATPVQREEKTPPVRVLPTISHEKSLTVADLCDIYEDHTRKSKMKRGKERAPKTIEGYLSGLDFIRSTLVSREQGYRP